MVRERNAIIPRETGKMRQEPPADPQSAVLQKDGAEREKPEKPLAIRHSIAGQATLKLRQM
jgi:hypothetical protein